MLDHMCRLVNTIAWARQCFRSAIQVLRLTQKICAGYASMQVPQVRVRDLFNKQYDGVLWESSAQRAKAYMAFYQRVKRTATNAKRRRSYAKLRFETRRRELLNDLRRTPGRQPRATTISKYGISWDAGRNEWVLDVQQNDPA